ncbi:hypothetical protein ACFPZ0_13400 [Streptomonospora nanhaiensis]|uniref:Uncharacterized protein n=1 Tax=Streptomonospora nanhaiensis TaxID=1323731 RepID=A0A853BQL2_9ACTN|nr:hypothetical protein [Streptomonospora nanhaiensis]MBV2366969.1 hypothetical protein [Streptomonospora nanhaiensis]MBX9389407.1 hypothetical protein [Streptomonospora nanhaiensis]NYI96956.1 hypothetical protein [Streptomonospora nanhaiensis]
MIPQLVTVGYRRPGGRTRRLHVPVLPVALVLSPLLLVAAAAGVVACLATRVSPGGALRGAGRLVLALPGTRLEIEQGAAAVLVSIR